MGMDQCLIVGNYEDIELRKCSFLHTYVGEKRKKKLGFCSCEYLTKEELRELREKLERVKNNPQLALELLPTSKIEGCFEGINPAFTTGSLEYNSSYFYDVERLLTFLEPLNIESLGEYDVVYSSD